MKICPAPIGDFMIYVDEIMSDRENHNYWHILQLMNDYYVSLTKIKTIMPVGEDFLVDWCGFCDYDTTMITCPNIIGTILYKTLRDGSTFWGILGGRGWSHPSWATLGQLDIDYQGQGVITLNEDGKLTAWQFNPSDWTGWGIPVRYFAFPDYVPSENWQLGERIVKPYDRGHDIAQLRAIIAHFDKTLPITWHYDKQLLDSIYRIQDLLGLPHSGKFDLELPECKKIIKYCIYGNSRKIKP